MILPASLGTPLGPALAIATLLLLVALVASVWRVLVGPTLADRIVALDLVSVLIVVFLVVFRLATGSDAYTFVAIGLALIAFLATVAFAEVLDRTGGDGDG